jgi:vitamin B12/bleomycin/antimicrobial peptide transport system ATP-binding/permease protein
MEAAAMADPDDQRPNPRGSVRAYWRLAGNYWKGPTAFQAWRLTVTGLVLVVGNIVVQYGINVWNRAFFNALQLHDQTFTYRAIVLFFILAFLAALVAVLQLIFRMKLQIRWRQWLTRRLVATWLSEQRFYRLNIAAPDLDAPEFRIAEDAKVATEPVVDFGYGIANAVLTAIVFFGVLWTASGPAVFLGWRIPGFMVYAAIVYSAVMSASMMLFGRALIARIEDRNRTEAQLRYEMGRVRENAESIAMVGGADDEITGLESTMQLVSTSWTQVVARQAWLTWLMGGNGVMAPVLPLLLAAPNYLSGEITLGALTQSAAAFVQVQVALNWLVDNYTRIAEWLASASRVTGLWTAFADLDASVGTEESDRITIEDSPDGNIHLDGLAVAQHDGRIMIDEADTVIAAGEKVLLMGESGTGKSTLIRAIAGLWPWGSGSVRLPVGAKAAFLPQRPYLPLGTLRQVLCYPDDGTTCADAVLQQALTRCGLKRLIPRMDEEEKWDKVLSGGEQQRIGFARLLVMQPDIVIMDEATAALDAASQDSMMELFRDELDRVTLISVGHRSELEDYHDRKLTLHRHATRVEMAAGENIGHTRRLSGLLRRTLRPRPSPDPSIPVSGRSDD